MRNVAEQKRRVAEKGRRLLQSRVTKPTPAPLPPTSAVDSTAAEDDFGTPDGDLDDLIRAFLTEPTPPPTPDHVLEGPAPPHTLSGVDR